MSVAGVHERLICVALVALPDRFAGMDGGVTSGCVVADADAEFPDKLPAPSIACTEYVNDTLAASGESA